MKKKKIVGLLLLLPLTIWLVAFALYPILYGLRLSLFNARINNIDNPTFIGLQNYIKLFSNSEFGQSLLWSLKFATICTLIQMVLGILISWLFQRDFPGKGLATTLILMPMVVAPFLMGTMFRLLFNESVGPIAYLLSGLTGTTALLGMAWVNKTIVVRTRSTACRLCSSICIPPCRVFRRSCWKRQPWTGPMRFRS